MEAFNIIGISVRTINKNKRAGIDISNLWNKWFEEQIWEQVPHKISDDIINMYTNYDTDEHDFYTAILGLRVSSLAVVPDGMVGVQIPTSNYKEFISKGKLPDCVLETWEMIWRRDIDRKYSADFDVYNPNDMNSENAQVKTYVSIN